MGFSFKQVPVSSPTSLQVTRPVSTKVAFMASVGQRRGNEVESFGEDGEFIFVERSGSEIDYRIFWRGPGRSQ